MKKALAGVLLMSLLAAACVTIIAPAPAAPPPVNNPPATPSPQAANPPQSQPASFNMPVVAVFTVQPANIMSGNYATLTWDIAQYLRRQHRAEVRHNPSQRLPAGKPAFHHHLQVNRQ